MAHHASLDQPNIGHNEVITSIKYVLTKCVHWILGVAFHEDERLIRTGHADLNLAVVRRIALNLLKQEVSGKLGIANKRLKASWDEPCLLRILLQESRVRPGFYHE